MKNDIQFDIMNTVNKQFRHRERSVAISYKYYEIAINQGFGLTGVADASRNDGSSMVIERT